MIPTLERRKQVGIAIVTSRPSTIKTRCGKSGLASRPLLVQPGPSWPEHRAPVVLDTIDLPAQELVALLADPPQEQNSLRAKPTYMPLIALAHPYDWRALRLLSLCPAVRLICRDDPAQLSRWFMYIEGSIPVRLTVVPTAGVEGPFPARLGVAPAIWLVDSPTDLKLDPLLLPALAILPSAPSLRIAAERCEVSVSTLARVIRSTRAALGLPPGDVFRFRPDELAAMILDRLGADAPMNERCM